MNRELNTLLRRHIEEALRQAVTNDTAIRGPMGHVEREDTIKKINEVLNKPGLRAVVSVAIVDEGDGFDFNVAIHGPANIVDPASKLLALTASEQVENLPEQPCPDCGKIHSQDPVLSALDRLFRSPQRRSLADLLRDL